ncbi:hypothetical protein J5681_01620 [bacterium]|nr:hypothetical protein [bacterium]
MKKSIIFALFCAFLLIVGCGDGNKKNDANEPEDRDFDTVDEDEQESVPDDGQTPEIDDSDSNEPKPDPVYYEKCSEIFTCYISCRSEGCLKSCLADSDKSEAEKFSEMYDCWLEKCDNKVLDDDFVSCVEENCKEKTDICEVSLKPEDGSKRFPKPYGKVSINLASNYIIVPDIEADSSALQTNDFAGGYIGSTAVEPDDYSAFVYYYTVLVDSEDGNLLETMQVHLDDDYNGTGTALLILPENVEKGNVTIGPDDASVGKLFFGVFKETGEVVCYDGFGSGKLEIKAVDPAAASAGKLAVRGNIDVLTPYNEPEKFDELMSKLGKPLCAPRYPKFAGRLMYESTFASQDDDLDGTSAVIDAEKYFAFDGVGIVPLEGESEGSLSIDLIELVGIGYALDYSNTAEFMKGMAETPEHPEGERAVFLSVGGTSVSIGVTLLLSDIQKMNGKPLKKAPTTQVYTVKWSYETEEYFGQYFPKYAKACLVAENKLENGVRVGEFQTSYYSQHDFDSTGTVASLSVVMSAELVDGDDLLAHYPEASTQEDLCFCSDTMTSEDVECDSVSGWRTSY